MRKGEPLQVRIVRLMLGALLSILASLAPAHAQTSDYPGWKDEAIPAGPVGDAIRLGEQILTQTRRYAASYAGNALNCTNCHLNGGRAANSAPWVGIWGVFPEFRSRNAKVNRLEDRVNDCFERSMNGRALPDDSAEMVGILAFMQWLSRGVPTGTDVPGRGFLRIRSPEPPNLQRGQVIFREKCMVCHGVEGQGLYGAQGEMIYPPLWGPNSFSIGAGMARLNTAAAFVKANMPFGLGGSLTDQEAFDVAAFFTTQSRPDFAGKDKDWVHGGKPADARY